MKSWPVTPSPCWKGAGKWKEAKCWAVKLHWNEMKKWGTLPNSEFELYNSKSEMQFYSVTQNHSPCVGEFTAKGRVELFKFHSKFIREGEYSNEFWTRRRPCKMVKNLFEYRWRSDRLENAEICKWNFANEFSWTQTTMYMVGIWNSINFAWIDTEWSGIPSTWNSTWNLRIQQTEIQVHTWKQRMLWMQTIPRCTSGWN